MRAREPDVQAYVDRDGLRIAYETFNDVAADHGRPTVLFVPIDSCVQSRAWKAQVPYLSQHYRVVTIDPRGNGRSDRPTDPAEYGDLDFVADTVAVMDAAGVDRAVLVGICVSAWQAMLVASLHAERVQGVVAIGPWLYDNTPPLPFRAEAAEHFEDELPSYEGWRWATGTSSREGWPEFSAFFFDQMLCEPHSTKQLEDIVGFDAARRRGGPARGPRTAAEVPRDIGGDRGAAARDRPAGARDPGHRGPLPAPGPGQNLAEVDRSRAPGPGGLRPPADGPATRSRSTARSRASSTGSPARPPPPRPRGGGTKRRPRALYLSSPIGLGHVRRDLAIADAMREQRPDLEIQWLTQSPVAEFLEQRGEVVHPASRAAGQRVGALRVGVGRARPARVPGRAADGRGAGQQLHGLRRPGGAGGVRPLAGRRGLGPRPLPAREPRAQAGAVRLDDRLRRAGCRCPTAATGRRS